MRWIDLSPKLRPGIATWPDDTPFGHERTARIGPGCPVNVSRLVLSSHTGSHADAPLHWDAQGSAIDALEPERFIGPAVVVDVRGGQGLIGAASVLERLPDRAERVLIRQYDRQPSNWDPDLRGLDPALGPALAARGVRLVGMDAASVDPASSKTLDAHWALGRAGITIVEGLVLDQVDAGEYELIALPLRIEGCDAAPVRAVLRSLR